MSPLEELLLELEWALHEALSTEEWISAHHDIDTQFLRHHIKSAVAETNYLQAQETPS